MPTIYRAVDPKGIYVADMSKPMFTGGTSYIHKAMDTRVPGKPLLLKMGRTPMAPHLLTNEVRHLNVINGRCNAPKVYWTGLVNGEPGFLINFVQGVSLLSMVIYIRNHRVSVPKPIQARLTHDLFQHVTDLHRLERNGRKLELKHLDLNLGNIFLTPRGRFSLIDFGLSSSIISHPLCIQGETKGTVGYMSPSQGYGLEPSQQDDCHALLMLLCDIMQVGNPYRKEAFGRRKDPANALRKAVVGIHTQSIAREIARLHADAGDLFKEQINAHVLLAKRLREPNLPEHLGPDPLTAAELLAEVKRWPMADMPTYRSWYRAIYAEIIASQP